MKRNHLTESQSKEIDQNDGLEGKKKLKTDDENPFKNYPDFRECISQQFDEEKIKQLIQHLKELESYYQFASFQIQHQNRSISILSKYITNQFAQIKDRVPKMVQRARFNVAFLDTFLFPYKQLVYESVKNQEQSSEHNHKCYHNQSQISNFFYHLVSQWGENPETKYIDKINQYLQKYLTKDENMKILVVGMGMGRILYEIKNKIGQNIKIQGHQYQIKKYLGAEYFLNRCKQSQSIYPYIHSFNNFQNNSDPYREIKIPHIINNHTYRYPLTLGKFQQLYKTHNQEWGVIITAYHNEKVVNILKYIRIVYKILKKGGIWIDICTSNFQKSYFLYGYQQYENILDNSQFKLITKQQQYCWKYYDQNSLMNQKRLNYYRVMQKL